MRPRDAWGLTVGLLSVVLVLLSLMVIVLEGHRPLSADARTAPFLRPQGPPVVFLRLSPPVPRTPRTPTSLPESGSLPDPADEAPGAPVVWVMDDMGRGVETAETVLRWPKVVAVAVLPDGAVAQGLSRRACEQGRDVLIHLPMASVRPEADPGPMAISARMADTAIRRILAEARRTIPCATGLNQHMGSRTSQEADTMARVVQAAGDLGLRFFIDSRTTGQSRLCDVAERLGRPCLRRTLFFDADASPAELPARWRQVVAHARRADRPVVVIAHPYPATLAFLDRLFRSGTWRSVRWKRPSEALGIPTTDR